MNKIGTAKFVKNQVKTALKTLAGPEETKRVMERTTFIETVANRMVLPVTEDFLLSKFQTDLDLLQHNVLDIFSHREEITDFLSRNAAHAGSSYKRKKARQINLAEATPPADTTPVKIPKSLSALTQLSNAVSEVTLTLFISEPDMPLYAAPGSRIVQQLRQIVVKDDIASMEMIKNKLSNGTHAIIAWYSQLLGYQTIGQGMGDKARGETGA